MHFDDLLKHVGEFGPYQKRVYFLLILPTIFTACQIMSPVFIMGDQTYWCDDIPIVQTSNITNTTTSRVATIEGILYTTNGTLRDQCYQATRYEEGANSSKPCGSWKYDTTVFKSTIISKFNMICDREHLQSFSKMALFAGTVMAALVEGSLGDIFGRKKIHTICFITVFASSLASAWVPNVVVFMILRFFTGLSVFGIFNMGIIIGLEIVGPSKRIWSGIVIELMFCVGEALLCCVAYFIRDWVVLQITISAPIVISLVYCFLIPESPRWLLLEGKKKDAMKILHKIAKSNKRELPVNSLEIDKEKKDNFRKSIGLILKSRVLLSRLIVMLFGWFVIAMTYYGITYNVGRIGGDVYLNFLLSVIVEFLGYSSCIVLSEKLGRKVVHCGSLLIGGIACIGTIFTTLFQHSVALNWITIALSMVGKCCISAAFGNVFLYTSELFPTGIRGFSLSTCNTGGRIGALLSPYIADLSIIVKSDAGKALPFVIFGAIATVVGLVSLTLPETVRMKLPQTVDEATNLQRYSVCQAVDYENDNIPVKFTLLSDENEFNDKKETVL